MFDHPLVLGLLVAAAIALIVLVLRHRAKAKPSAARPAELTKVKGAPSNIVGAPVSTEALAARVETGPAAVAGGMSDREKAVFGPPIFNPKLPSPGYVVDVCHRLGVESVEDPRLNGSDVRFIRALCGQPLDDQRLPGGRISAVYDTEGAAKRRLVILGASVIHAAKAVNGIRFGSEIRMGADHRPELIPIAPVLRKEYGRLISEPTPAQWQRYLANWEATQR